MGYGYMLLGFCFTLGIIVTILFLLCHYIPEKVRKNQTPSLIIITLVVFAGLAVLSSVIPVILAKILFTVLSLVGIGLCVYAFAKKKIRVLTSEIVLVVVLVMVCSCFFCAEVNQPQELPDGPYVSKEWHEASKIQKMLNNLPMDNAIPYLVSEMLVNRLDLTINNESAPNQYVTSRGIIVSLLTEPTILTLGGINEAYFESVLPRFEYYGNWINTLLLYNNEHFLIFLGSYVALLFVFLLGIGRMLHNVYSEKATYIFLALFFTNYYIVTQMLFTWPKIFCGFLFAMMLLTLENKEIPFQNKVAQCALACGITIHFHLSGAYSILIVSCVILIMILKRYGLRIYRIFKKFSTWDYAIIAIGAIVFCLEVLRPLYMHTPNNLYSQNNLGELSLMEKLPHACRLVLEYSITIPKNETEFFQLTSYSFAFSALPLLLCTVKKIRNGLLSLIALFATVFMIAITFENISSIATAWLGLQTVMPLLIVMAAISVDDIKLTIPTLIIQELVAVVMSVGMAVNNGMLFKSNFPFIFCFLAAAFIPFIFVKLPVAAPNIKDKTNGKVKSRKMSKTSNSK